MYYRPGFQASSLLHFSEEHKYLSVNFTVTTETRVYKRRSFPTFGAIWACLLYAVFIPSGCHLVESSQYNGLRGQRPVLPLESVKRLGAAPKSSSLLGRALLIL